MTGPPAGPRRAGARAALAWPGIAVALVLAVFLAPAFRSDVGFLYRDAGRVQAPTKRWIAGELSQGRVAQWNPYAGLGNPVVPNAFDAPLHPFNALLVALPPVPALNGWVILSFAVAAAGAFAWSRSMGWGAAASAVAALAFSLSGPLVSSTDTLTVTTYAMLPWVLAAAQRHVARGGPATLGLVGLASLLCVSAGDPQGWLVLVALLPAYAVVGAARGERRRAALRGVAASFAAAVAAAPVILPLVLWVPHSERAGGGQESARNAWNLHPRRLPELAVPGIFAYEPGELRPAAFDAYAGNVVTHDPWFVSIYLGAAVLALAALGAARDRRVRWLAAAAVAFAWVSLGPHAGAAQLVAHVPVIGSLRFWEKMTIWIALAAAIAAARGAHALVSGDGGGRLWRAVLASAAAALAVAAVAWGLPGAIATLAGGPAPAARALAANLARGALHAGLALGVAALLLRARLRPHAMGAAVVALVAADLAIANAGAYVLVPAPMEDRPPLARALGPADRVITSVAAARGRTDLFPALGPVGSAWEWARRTLVPAWNVSLGVTASEGYAPLREARWDRLVKTLSVAGRDASLGLFGFGKIVAPFDPSLARRAGAGEPLRVVGSDPALPAYLVEVPHRPRAYVTGRVTRVDERGAFAFAVAGGTPGAAVVEGPVRSAEWPDAGAAQVVEDRPGRTVVQAQADAPALLVLNDLFAPGWSAAVDGTPAEIVRANYVARGVWLGPGEHRVEFRYRTPGLDAGLAAAALGALALAAWAVARRRRARVTRAG